MLINKYILQRNKYLNTFITIIRFQNHILKESLIVIIIQFIITYYIYIYYDLKFSEHVLNKQIFNVLTPNIYYMQ